MLFRLALRTRHVKPTQIATWHALASYREFATSARFKQDDSVSLKVGGSGFVDLKITRPTLPPTTTNSNILVRLPPGPFPEDSDSKEPDVLGHRAQELSRQFHDTTVIDVQYRLTARPKDGPAHLDHRFPTPIHDIYTAWDYIRDELASHTSTNTNTKICLCGSHIGGALALTLALTNPEQIHAIAIENPLVDWVILDELAGDDGTVSRRRTTKRDRDLREAAQSLIRLRTRLFRTPSAYFDAFASPTMFLRAPGRDTPLTKSAAVVGVDNEAEGGFVDGARIRYREEEGEVGIVEYDDHEGERAYGPYDDDWGAVETRKLREGEYARRHGVTASDSASTASSEESSSIGKGSDDASDERSDSSTDDSAESPRRRKVLRRWPPNAQPEEVTLPYVNVFLTKPVGSSAASSDHTDVTPITWLQGMELVELLKRACFWGRERSFAEERVTLMERDSTANRVDQQKQMIEWLRTKFDESD
ncbi:hypothetical protein PMZ80_002031 [Knufia obscura]|uniref:Alpha/beta hydrolase fold-3 domain-containing protein n=1 Tax=Knufia obscura TaxID=1635080 RepID=A0ABR0RW63_9EURO|nr:hypothetical protein PMZ80_002031 [Knufia obscura]